MYNLSVRFIALLLLVFLWQLLSEEKNMLDAQETYPGVAASLLTAVGRAVVVLVVDDGVVAAAALVVVTAYVKETCAFGLVVFLLTRNEVHVSFYRPCKKSERRIDRYLRKHRARRSKGVQRRQRRRRRRRKKRRCLRRRRCQRRHRWETLNFLLKVMKFLVKF